MGDKKFAIYLSDTVIIGKNSGNQVITYEVSRKYEEVSYNLNDNDDEKGEDEASGEDS